MMSKTYCETQRSRFEFVHGIVKHHLAMALQAMHGDVTLIAHLPHQQMQQLIRPCPDNLSADPVAALGALHQVCQRNRTDGQGGAER